MVTQVHLSRHLGLLVILLLLLLNLQFFLSLRLLVLRIATKQLEIFLLLLPISPLLLRRLLSGRVFLVLCIWSPALLLCL